MNRPKITTFRGDIYTLKDFRLKHIYWDQVGMAIAVDSGIPIDPREAIADMVQHQDKLYVITECGKLYSFDGEQWVLEVVGL